MGTTAEELRTRLAIQRSDMSSDLIAIGDRVSPGRIAQRRKAAIRQRATHMKERIMGAADDTTTTLHDAAIDHAAGMAQTVRHAPDTVRKTAEGNPLAAGLVAFGAGLLIATVIPETRSETELAEKMQPHLEEVATSMGSSVQEAVEALKPAAQEAVGDVQQHAQKSMAAVKDRATDGAS